MKRLLLLLLVASTSLLGQNQYTISGYISDEATGEALIGANIWAPTQRVGTSSNVYGFYSLTLPEGTHVVRLQYLGYATMNFEIELTENIDQNFEMKGAENFLDEVEVIASEGVKIEE